jgi:predicted CXXCH cytochrome family protein
MPSAFSKSRGIVALGLIALAGAIALIVWLNHKPDSPPPDRSGSGGPELPPLTQSRYVNTGPDSHYIGIDACKKCHPSNHASYLLTAHSRALSAVDPNAEPADTEFHHAASKRTYRVYRANGELHHEEVVKTADGKEVGRIDLPVRYLVGSGHFTRSYLVEVDGFLHESPITWYTSRKEWNVSPGYDFPRNQSFERVATVGCLSCHAGRVEPEGNAVNRLKILEQSIGCESCHGPGSLHAERYRPGNHVDGDDLTIVNPKKLPRADLESVCAVCHLSGVATVYHRGRKVTDYRPGMPLSDYRTDYRFDTGSESMTVVGHVEQLRRSACYQKSPEMNCLTCHDPHEQEKPRDVMAAYRQKCLSCHESKGCRADEAERTKKAPGDNCMTCHMPRGDTDIPHIAFTHHRIGHHMKTRSPADPTGMPNLVPIGDVSHLSEPDQKRDLGLAYLSALDQHAKSPQQKDAFRSRARDLLEEVERANLRDPSTASGLARIYFDDGDARSSEELAKRALESRDLRADARADALLTLVNCHIRDKRYDDAINALQKVTRLRRYSGDWRLLGMCYLEQGRPNDALIALKEALAIRPWRPDVHLGLATVYERLGDAGHAREHYEKAQWLAKNNER